MTLHVECSPEGFTYTEDPAFVNKMKLYVEGNTQKIYKILPPTISLPYCVVEKNELVEVHQNSNPDDKAMVLAIKCNGVQPCWELDSHELDYIHFIRFKIKTTVTGGFTHTSRIVIISVICNIHSPTLTSSVYAPQYYNYT
jgi:hypothetical protein